MKEDIKKDLEALIQEQKVRIPRLQVRNDMLGRYYYGSEDEDEYTRWLTKTSRFLRTYFKNDEDIETFENVSKNFLKPSQQKKLLSILESFLEYPGVIERRVEEVADLTKGGHHIVINNKNIQSQQQSQYQEIEILTKSLENVLSISQWKELKQVVKEEGDLEKAKPKLIDKIKSFGENVASNIVANIITNPAIWSCLG